MNENNVKNNLSRGVEYISKLSSSKKEKLLNLLKKVQDIQASDLTTKQKAKEIKRIMM